MGATKVKKNIEIRTTKTLQVDKSNYLKTHWCLIPEKDSFFYYSLPVSLALVRFLMSEGNKQMSKRIHLIAIGGAAMHNLALALKNKGYEISGSDDEIFEPSLSRLKNAGILPEQMGWSPGKIDTGIDVVILGMHARKDNPELLKAQKLGLTIMSYPEYLYEQTKNKQRIVVAGSHGKTTITAMILHVLKSTGKKFDYMVGSQIEGFDTMVSLSDETELAVFEGDEYLSSPIDRRPKFIHYHPHIGVISGIAWDHINVFPTFEEYKQQFQLFIDKIEPGGKIIYCGHDNHLLQLTQIKRTGIRYKEYKEIPNKVTDGKTIVYSSNNEEYPLHVFGNHNMQNIAAAKEVCVTLGISEKEFFKAISTFSGTKRRLEKTAERNESIVFYDFAHSPSKVKATVDAVKEQYQGLPLIACFELHTFSSLNKHFLDEYNGCLEKADKALVFYDPHVIEHKKLEKITTDDIQNTFNKKNLTVFTTTEKLEDYLLNEKKPAVFLLMSSGNFGGIDILDFSTKLVAKFSSI